MSIRSVLSALRRKLSQWSDFNRSGNRGWNIEHGAVVYSVEGASNAESLPSFGSRLFQETQIMQQILDGLHVERSLEIGCGYGRLSPWIALHSERHYGVEPSGDSLEAARRQFPDFGWVRGRAESLPFPDDSHFDLVVTWTVLQHIPDDAIAKAAKEIRRVLDPNGVLVMCEVTGGDRADHVWPRSVAEYEELFHPHSCVQSLARRVERTYGVEDVGEVMRFEA